MTLTKGEFAKMEIMNWHYQNMKPFIIIFILIMMLLIKHFEKTISTFIRKRLKNFKKSNNTFNEGIVTICPKCGSQIKENNNFCIMCGTKINNN